MLFLVEPAASYYRNSRACHRPLRVGPGFRAMCVVLFPLEYENSTLYVTVLLVVLVPTLVSNKYVPTTLGAHKAVSPVSDLISII